MENRLAGFVTLLMSLVFTHTVSAQVVTACNGCTQIQMMQAAKAEGNGTHYIGDMQSGAISGYSVTTTTGPQAAIARPDVSTPYPPVINVVLVAVPTNVQNGFANWVTLEKSVAQGSTIVAPVPNPRPPGWPPGLDNGSGLQWASESQFLNGFESFMQQMQSCDSCTLTWANSSITGFIAMVDLVVSQSGVSLTVLGSTLSPNPILFIFDANDGSQISINFKDGTATLTKVVDKYGNTIPLNKNQANGAKFKIPPSDTNYSNAVSQYLNQQLGYIIVPGSSGGSTTTPHGATCVESTDGDGNTTYTCTIF